MDVGRLIATPPRKAWPHEAQDFTPWLAANLDQLSEIIGIPLELQDTEVKVEAFSADILAQNPHDGTLVLIENQLEITDHTHLGQIMTYLAGLGAAVVVWIATDYREPHLSAIRWLNEHTVDPFAFFAIRLRVVRIGDSLPAPVFDVLERPNNWERQVQAATREGGFTELHQFRQEFWQRYVDRYPDDQKLGIKVNGAASKWIPLSSEIGLVISVYLAQSEYGIFVRGPRGVTADSIHPRISHMFEQLNSAVGGAMHESDGVNHAGEGVRADMAERANWDEAIDWMHERIRVYMYALSSLLSED